MSEKVTIKEYGEAVAVLIPLARGGTSGGRAAAQVLLSAYNGGAFQLDVTDLCNLSRDNYRAAIIVIRGRAETGYEPHTLVKDGEKHFHDLWDRWQKSLHVGERGKEVCFDCNGSGKVPITDDEASPMITCGRCGGRGRYWPA